MSPTNMVQLARELPTRARGRACIVLTHEYKDQKEWAAELARQSEYTHIDLLELFAEDKELAGKVGTFTVPVLFEFLKGYSQSPVLIVSGMEFIKATWTASPNAVEEFASRVETWDISPSLLFVLQHDAVIATRSFRRYRQYTFVVDQRETFAL